MRNFHFIGLLMATLLLSATISTAAETLTKEDAVQALKDIEGEVIAVAPSEVPGLYQVTVKMQDRNIPVYLDSTGTYMISGNIIDLQQRRNLTEELFRRINPVDVSAIPLDDALTLGDPDAQQQIIVFTDPHCPYCSQLHKVLYEAIDEDPNLVFQIKLLALQQSSQRIAQTILCNNSMEQLEQAFAGEALPEPTCQSDVLQQNQALAQSLQISGTPTLIMPNGQIHAGYQPLEELMELIRENSVPATN